MAQPTPGDLHVNQNLTNVSIAYIQSEATFVAGRAGHIVPVSKQTDYVPQFKKGAFFRDEMKLRVSGTESAGGGFEIDSPLTYSCPVKAYHHDIPDDVRANADSQYDLDKIATILCAQKALIRCERQFAYNFMASSTSSWDVKREGVASGSYSLDTNVINWSDYSNSNPIADVQYYATKIQLASGGFRPRHAVMTRQVWDTLKLHPDFIALVSGGATTANPSIVELQLVARQFELESLLVMEGVYDSALENATFSPAWIGGDAFLLYYKPPAPGLMMPSAFYGFGWQGMSGMNTGQRIRKFRMENLLADRVEIDAAFDWKTCGTDMAALLYGLTT